MSRRGLVKAMGASTVGFASVSHLSARPFETATTDSVSIVYAYAREDPDDPASIAPRTKTVSAGWYDDLQAALASYDTIDFTAIDGVHTASVVPGNGNGRSAISVGATSETVLSGIDELLEGIPIEGSIIETAADGGGPDLEPARQFDLESGFAVPGGVACGETEGLATLAPAVYDSTGESAYFATADHLYAETESTELTLVSGGARVPVGEVRERYHNEDLALIAPTTEYVPDSAIDGDAPNRVVGQFTRIGLADLTARGVEIHKIGAMSGHTTGEIQAIDGVTCVYGDPCKRGQLKWGDESEFTDGDSGSVSYAPDPENPDEQVLVCGLNNARTWWPGEDYIWGTGAYVFQEEYGYTF
ncbi:MAG: hypothetical protein QXG03_06290 [Halalkalicoccus sp.]